MSRVSPRGHAEAAPGTSDVALAPKAAPVASSIAHEIIDGIRRGIYPVGARLPSENALATQFNVSRPAIREALSAVQFVGYAESARGAGYFVVSAEPTFSAGDLTAPADEPPLRRHHNTIRLLEARLVLEPRVVGYAALDPDPTCLQMAAKLIEGMRVAIRDPQFDANTDIRIHIAFVECCRNPLLVEPVRKLLVVTGGPVWTQVRTSAWADPEVLAQWVHHHEIVHSALTDRRPADAERASRHHLVSVVESALQSGEWEGVDRARLETLRDAFAVQRVPAEADDLPGAL